MKKQKMKIYDFEKNEHDWLRRGVPICKNPQEGTTYRLIVPGGSDLAQPPGPISSIFHLSRNNGSCFDYAPDAVALLTVVDDRIVGFESFALDRSFYKLSLGCYFIPPYQEMMKTNNFIGQKESDFEVTWPRDGEDFLNLIKAKIRCRE